MGDLLLRNDELVLQGVQPAYRILWRWHAVEEVEHKAVAYDAMEKVYGSGPWQYVMRVGTFLLANAVFWPVLYVVHIMLCWHAGCLFDLRGWWTVLNLQWGVPGLLRSALPEWRDYFKPSFHPWRTPGHDNSDLLKQVPSVEAEAAPVQRSGPARAYAAPTA